LGLTVTAGSLTVAGLKPDDATDTRAWSVVYGTGLGGGLSFGDAFAASVSGLTVKSQANRAAPLRGIEWSAIDPLIDVDAATRFFVEGEAGLSIASGVLAGTAHFAVGTSAVTITEFDGPGGLPTVVP